MMAWAGTTTWIDNFDRAQIFSTTPGHNGWTIKDTSSAGTPTYLCATEDGGSAVLTIANNTEAEVLTLYQNDVLPFDLRMISHVWWVAKVAAIQAESTLVLGVANAQNDTADTVGVSAWFRMEGGDSTTALVVETDDVTNNNDDKATGVTLAAVYKKLLIDFTQGLNNVRFFVDGARVAAGTTFDMSDVATGQNVQPFVQSQKSSAAGQPVVTIAQFGITYKWTYGA
jgi:hypothetical protein